MARDVSGSTEVLAASRGGGNACGPPGEEDARWMRRAVAVSHRGWGRVSPNPLVGAVLVREGRVVAEGWHAELGGPHAEVVALRAAREGARGATLYVTLEPCAHEGRTPPCTEAILEAGIRRVVIACRDPHGRAAAGADRLRAAGVDVSLGVEAVGACRANAGFLWRHARGVPFGALKLALSLDARLARRPGERSAVTGPRAWEEVHRLRAGHDAVLVGRRTAEVDDPRLTVRRAPPPRRPPVRVVLDSDARLPHAARLVRTAREIPTWVLAAPDADPRRKEALARLGVRVLEVPRAATGGVDPREGWRRLAREGLASVLVEGGGRVASSLLEAGLVQRLHLLYAPVLFGAGGVPAFPGGPAAGAGWRPVRRGPLGADTLLVLEGPELEALGRELAGPGRASHEEREGPAPRPPEPGG